MNSEETKAKTPFSSAILANEIFLYCNTCNVRAIYDLTDGEDAYTDFAKAFKADHQHDQ